MLRWEKMSHSARKMRSYEKIFPRFTEISVAGGEILVRQGNFQVMWIERFCK